MKALTKHDIGRPAPLFPLPSELFPSACLLATAGMLAIVGGVETATLFFGMLLLFALLLAVSRSAHGNGKDKEQF